MSTATLPEILKCDHPALRTACAPVTADDDLSFIDDMRRVLRATDNGVGLAAPQIGVLKRACVIWHMRKGGEFIVMLNPEIRASFGPLVTADEGCLSYPGVNVPVERSNAVMVQWDDTHPEWSSAHLRRTRKLRTFVGYQARVVQHEMDHLDGICLVGDAWRATKGS